MELRRDDNYYLGSTGIRFLVNCFRFNCVYQVGNIFSSSSYSYCLLFLIICLHSAVGELWEFSPIHVAFGTLFEFKLKPSPFLYGSTKFFTQYTSNLPSTIPSCSGTIGKVIVIIRVVGSTVKQPFQQITPKQKVTVLAVLTVNILVLYSLRLPGYKS